MGEEALGRYRAKRRFEDTPEPAGDAGPSGGSDFVVQKHAARRLHYDLRLEVDGVMVSWAVPKGPSYDPGVKRLAVHVEDHPLDYNTFEGTIPAGNYGAGTVMVWDAGSYRNLTERHGRPVPVGAAVEAGHVSVWLEGSKLRGGWSLTRTGSGQGGDSWIMVKRRDDHADADLDIEATAPASVQSGRSMEEIAGGGAAPAGGGTGGSGTGQTAWAAEGADDSGPGSGTGQAGPGDGPDTWTAARATWQPPMLAEPAPESWWPPRDPGEWLYERKLDGLRCVAVRNGERVELWSRNHLSFTARFPEVAAALGALAVDNFTFDGELVAFDGHDFAGFAGLQRPDRRTRAVYVAFDLVHLLGRDTRALVLGERKQLLERALAPGPFLQLAPALDGDPAGLLAAACAAGWEGLVAKRVGSPYAGRRSGDWRKLKCSASQELVIGGWTDPRGARTGFGALLLGYHEGDRLRYAGKVGTGFSTDALHRLHAELVRRERDTSPFADPVPERRPHWAKPDLVAEVAFTEWTPDGRLRHPRFQGLRPDKDAASVVRERPGA